MKGYFKRFKIFTFRSGIITLLLSICLLVTMVVFFYVRIGNVAQKSLYEQTLHRQTVLARASAKTIERYFYHTEKELLLLSSLPTIKKGNISEISVVLKEAFKNIAEGPIVDILRISEDGDMMVRGSDITEPSNVEGREYFYWSQNPKNKDVVYYSECMVARGGPSKGKNVKVLVTPIWDEKNYKGLLMMVISLDKLGETFIEETKLTENSESFIFHSDGDIIASSRKELLSVNIFEHIDTKLGGDQYLVSNTREIVSSRGGKIHTEFIEPSKKGKYLITHEPIFLAKGEQQWAVAIVVPEEDALEFFGPFYNYGVIGLVLLVGLITVFSFLVINAERKMYITNNTKTTTKKKER